MFLSPFSFADWGDVYYCQMTSFVGTDAEGTVTKYKLEKFQFKLDKSQQAAVYGNSGYFKGWRGKLADWATHRPEERWTTKCSIVLPCSRRESFLVLMFTMTLSLLSPQTAISSNCEYPAGMPQVMYKQSSLKSSQRSLTKRARGVQYAYYLYGFLLVTGNVRGLA